MSVSVDNRLRRCEDALRVAAEHGQWDTAMVAKVRSMVGEELAATVMATARLQTKARVKLGEGLWWCTERSLSQATPIQVAELKSRWLAPARVADLCCGLGGDAVAIARAVYSESEITIVDNDTNLIEMAVENLRLNSDLPQNRLHVHAADVAEVQLPADCAIHIDPDRRSKEQRKTRPEDYSPNWDFVQRLVRERHSAIVKLAPAAELEDAQDQHRVWISLGGSVREQSLLVGEAVAQAGKDLAVDLASSAHSAISLKTDGTRSSFCPNANDGSAEVVDKPSEFMIDPDAAVRAAGLTESFALQNQLQMIGGPAGFLTGTQPPVGDMAICERVVWSGSCDDRKLRKTLRSMNCFPWRIKTRGVSQNPNVLEKRYRKCGEDPITLWIGAGRRRQYAVITVGCDTKLG